MCGWCYLYADGLQVIIRDQEDLSLWHHLVIKLSLLDHPHRGCHLPSAQDPMCGWCYLYADGLQVMIRDQEGLSLWTYLVIK